ncbi:hypothetical protein [Exiguobacterium sp. S22-S28]
MPGIDPFLMQLFIVPAVVIGVGVFVSISTRQNGHQLSERFFRGLTSMF